jgi:tetratricopeptide (TPR) repeat protein
VAEALTRHVAGCAECGERVKIILQDEEEYPPDPQATLAGASLPSATPAGRRALAARIRSQSGIPMALRLAAAITGVGIAIGMSWYYFANRRATPEQLIARAYSAHRSFPYRLPAGGEPGPVRVTRSAVRLSDFPSSTLEALTGSQEALAARPSDPARLLVAGQARLQALDLDSAQEMLESAYRQSPSDNAAASSLAILLALLAERAQADESRALLRRSLNLLDDCIRQRPGDAAARFNRALVLERLARPDEAAAELRQAIAQETDPAWQAEYRAALESIPR